MLKQLSIINPRTQRLGWGQSTGRPSIYLDHWAIRDISEDKTLASRFRNVVLQRGGGLAISLTNLIEFSQVSDARQIAAAEQFIDSLLPNIFFIEANYAEVIAAELNGKRVPHSSDFLCNLFTFDHAVYGAPLTMRDRLASMARNQESNKADTSALAKMLIEKMNNEYFPELEKIKIKDRNATLTQSRSGVECVFFATIEYLYGRRNSPLKENDITDLLHMLVPVCRCNYVLLDSNTKQTVIAVTNRMEKLLEGRKIKIASTYSKSDLPRFFEDLEAARFDSIYLPQAAA